MTTLDWHLTGPNLVVEGNNLELPRSLPDGSFKMIYLDPPFN
jgi:site-specific DNA-methyltransferase (adenine-specific)